MRTLTALGLVVFLTAASSFAADLSIEEAASNCFKESRKKRGATFHHLNGEGKPYHRDGSVYMQVGCQDSKAAEDYLKAASKVFQYSDERYSADAPDATRRVFFREKDTDRIHMCMWRGPESAREKLICYFNLVIPGTTLKSN